MPCDLSEYADVKVQTTDISPELDAFLDKTFALLKNYWASNEDPNEKVVQTAKTDEIIDAVKITLNKDNVETTTFDEMYASIEQTLKYAVRTSHPCFMNQLYGNTDIMGVLGELITTFCNTNIHTFEVSPVFTLMENEVMQKFCHYMGYTNGDGVFAPGGSICNIYGMLLARNNACPDIRMNGFGGKTLVCLTSDECHYSIQKGANLCGIGINNVWMVKCNDIGQMIPEEVDRLLQKAKDEGKTPFMVNSTAGSTVKGAFDDIHALADICKKHDVWLHLDAAWGGSACMSEKRKHLLAGSERVDSITWDPHKGMGIPVQTAVILTREKGKLQAVNAFKAEYLFKDANLEKIVARGGEGAKNAAAELSEKKYDLGDKTFQCGRHVDSTKVWVMFKMYGNKYFSDRVENGFRNRDYLVSKITENPDAFELVSEPMYLNVCFWYIPPSARNLPKGSPERKQKIDQAVQSIRRSMHDEGKVLLNYQPQGELPNFFRPVLCSSNTTTAHMDLIMERIESFGASL